MEQSRTAPTSDTHAMRRALALARRGSGLVHPNPMVGALVQSEGKIIGYGWHARLGGPHAESEALRMAGARARGAELFVTLEPCNHFGKTPPCVRAILEAGVRRVVVATPDPNPDVTGGGIEALRKAGVVVDVGLLEDEAREINRSWFHRMETGRPFVTLKLAVSRDWRLSRADKGWISGPISRALVHRMRRAADVIMVGKGTVLADDPLLTNRTGLGSQPTRIVLDSKLEVPLSARVYHCQTSRVQFLSTITFTAPGHDLVRRAELLRQGVEVVEVRTSSRGLEIPEVLRELSERGVSHVFCEGGPRVAASLLQERLCDRIILFQSDKVIRGPEEKQLPRLDDMTRDFRLALTKRVGGDKLFVYDRFSRPTLVAAKRFSGEKALPCSPV